MNDLPTTTHLELELTDGWLTIWLNRPESRNALSGELVAELSGVLRTVQPDRSVRGITIRGRGGVFCAGADLKAFRAIFQSGGSDLEPAKQNNREAGRLFGLIDRMPQVVVMLVEGAAMAGGMGMLCGGDVVVAMADAKFALTETSIGIAPAQIAPFVIKRLGAAVGRRLMLTGARFDGREAARLGLVDYVAADVAELEQIEAGIRRDVLRCAPGAVAATKELILAIPSLAREEMVERAAECFAQCLLGDEGREGIASFLEKRKPAWARD